MVLGSVAVESALSALRKRIAGFEARNELAASTDFVPLRRLQRKDLRTLT
jgi:hypothetical protein